MKRLTILAYAKTEPRIREVRPKAPKVETSTKTRALKWLRALASCASRAANHSGRDREYATLTDIIAKQERQHRKSGHSFAARTDRRFTLTAATDYFVVRTLNEGLKLGAGPVANLVGIRDDYTRAAILMACPRFREALEAEVKAEFPDSVTLDNVLSMVEAIDYTDLVGGPP